MTERRVQAIVRVGLFLAFAGYLAVVKFAPHYRAPWSDAEATVLAANAGYSFQLLFPAGNGQPPVVKKMSEIYGDYGIHILLSLTARVGRAFFGPSFQVTAQAGWVIVLLFFIATAAVIVATPVPLTVGSAGIVSLWALFKWGTLGLSDARHWGVTYTAVIGAVYLGTVLHPWTRTRVIVLSLLAGLVAYSQLLRQEAAPASYIAAVALLASAAVTWLVALSHARVLPPARLMAVARRTAIGGLLLIVFNAAIPVAERWCFSRAWGTPFRETRIAAHGVGWPLYLSLGYVSNPYNIGWRDPIGEVHAQLINPLLDFDHPAFQSRLFREFVQIVFNRPWLLFSNIAAKAARVHELSNHPSGATTGTTVTHPWPLVYAYRAVPWVLLTTFLVLAWRGSPEGVTVWVTSVALACGTSAGSLIVFPEYIGGVQGSTMALVLVLPAAVIGSGLGFAANDVTSVRLSRHLLVTYMMLLLAIAAMAATFVGIQAWRYQRLQNATVSTAPVRAINSQEFRYAHVFNDLSVAKQNHLVAELKGSTDPTVAAKVDDSWGDLEMFRPEVVVRTESQVHVIAWMGRGFTAPVPRLFQGATHASLLICGGCPASTTVNDELPLLKRWTMISDLEWQGRYRMFSVLMPRTIPIPDTMRTAPFFRVTAERTVALDNRLPTGMRPQLIATARLTF